MALGIDRESGTDQELEIALELGTALGQVTGQTALQIESNDTRTERNGAMKFAIRSETITHAWISGWIIQTGQRGESIAPIVGRRGRL